jgi:hypothetical protein
MRIAYSFAGEGLGHATRTAVIGPLLEKKHYVVYFTPDTVRDFVISRIHEGRFERILHFSFQKKGERVQLLASILCTIPLLFRIPFEMMRLVDRLLGLRIDAVISDFDPFLPWAARIAGIPILQINHPGVVQRVLRPRPIAMITALATRVLEGPWNERTHISFYDGDVGPILREEIFAYPVRNDGPLLVNLKDCLRPVVLPVLDALGLRYQLVPDPRSNFEKALAACSFVLSTAGHQIIAESIALNKPILVIPQRGQWEQQLNAEMVEETGKGKSTTIERLSTDILDFKLHLERYRSNRVPPQFTITDDRKALLRRIEAFLRRCREPKIRSVSNPRTRDRHSHRLAPAALNGASQRLPVARTF